LPINVSIYFHFFTEIGLSKSGSIHFPATIRGWLKMPRCNSRAVSLAFTGSSLRVAFLDNLRYLMVIFVLIYHSCGAYATVAPHWVVHDTSSFAADIIRELFDVFMMPVLFFISGYFALASLQKKGAGEFLKDKVKRLLIPWALAVLIFLPLVIYDQPQNTVRPFWKYWLWYMGSFETRLRYSQSPEGLTTQAVYWFISLLFTFLLLLAFVSALIHQQGGKKILPAERKGTSEKSVLVALLIFGLLTSIGYSIALLLFPDSSWFTLQMFLEFQVTRLVPYAACFAFGLYARSRGWFADGKPLGSLALWGTISAMLAVAYLMEGQPLFSDTAGRANLSIGLLLIFAFLRSFLLLSLLVILMSVGARYWKHVTGLDRQLSATSYDIYLIHYWVVVAIQAALLIWVGGPVLIKVAMVSAGALALSFAISRWVLARHSCAFALIILSLFVFCLAVRP
jgi:glucans biosynthesis protein C